MVVFCEPADAANVSTVTTAKNTDADSFRFIFWLPPSTFMVKDDNQKPDAIALGIASDNASARGLEAALHTSRPGASSDYSFVEFPPPLRTDDASR